MKITRQNPAYRLASFFNISNDSKNHMPKVLLIEDEASIRAVLKDILKDQKELGLQVEEAKDGAEGLAKLESEHFDLALCDIKMPKMDGMEVLQKAKEKGIATTFIMISAHGTTELAVDATKMGAYDFLQKPPDLNRLLITVRNALDKTNLVKEAKQLKKKVSPRYEMIGESPALEDIKMMIEKVAPTDARVLITGPNGSGKELVARQIHEKSNRSRLDFVEVNCAAIPPDLIESELFGHEKGAFTSAIKQRIGKFEQAEGGTLFLDEIGDMTLAAQAKVLRALQENKITRVGAEKDVSVNVRVLAATNKDLRKEIAENKFREDLYHRLSVIVIKVPSLNERITDIPLLVNKFLEDIALETGSKKKEIEESALQSLSEYNWTGNIRELRNVVERLIIMSDNMIMDADVKKYL